MVIGASFFGSLSFGKEEEKDDSDLYTVPKLVAIQNRNYNLNQNLSLMLGYLPNDAFTKAFTAGAAYTYYFTDFTAWEIVNATYAFKIDTGLRRDLIDFFQAQPENDRLLDFVEYYATTNLVYTPLYNKSLLFNKTVVSGETSLVVGGGMGKFYQAGFQPIVGGGVILKYFLGPNSSIKIDARELVYFDEVKGTSGILDIKVGLDFQVGDTLRER